jgi:hypothetical protein
MPLDLHQDVDHRGASSTGSPDLRVGVDFGAEFTPELREQEERLRAQIATKT